MPIWNKTNKKPTSFTRQQRRNIMATDQGWVSRRRYVDQHGRTRTKEVMLVPINGLANSTFMGSPDIDDLWFSRTAVTTGTVVNTWISFNEPITSTSPMRLTVANTAGGAVRTATANTTVYGTNKLLFRWTPTVAGTYKVQAQNIVNSTLTATNIRSANSGTEPVSLVISGPVSNTGGLVIVT